MPKSRLKLHHHYSLVRDRKHIQEQWSNCNQGEVIIIRKKQGFSKTEDTGNTQTRSSVENWRVRRKRSQGFSEETATSCGPYKLKEPLDPQKHHPPSPENRKFV